LLRTYGAYQVYIDGNPVAALSGHIYDCTGPGDNTANGKKQHLRIQEGRCALSTQYVRHYRSVDDETHRSPQRLSWCMRAITRPSLSVKHRLLQPHQATWSDDNVMFAEARPRNRHARQLGAASPSAFDKVGHNTAIAEAFLVVDGEPMTKVSDDLVAYPFCLRSYGAVARKSSSGSQQSGPSIVLPGRGLLASLNATGAGRERQRRRCACRTLPAKPMR
jgi:hypothetical protein